jgi:quinol monooxygenase YgiN
VIRHIAMLRWKQGTTDAQVDEIEAALRPMPEVMRFIRRYELHRDLGINSSHHFVVMADFRSADEYREYASNPEHQQVIDTLIAPALESIARVQIEV